VIHASIANTPCNPQQQPLRVRSGTGLRAHPALARVVARQLQATRVRLITASSQQADVA